MTNTTAPAKTDREFMDEIIALIDGTHWTKSALACPVFEFDEYVDKSGRKRKRMRTDENGNLIVVKTTCCIVGLIMKVADLDPRWSNGQSNSPKVRKFVREQGGIYDESAIYEADSEPVPLDTNGERGRQAGRVVLKINETIRLDRHEYNEEGLGGQIDELEGWNDNSKRTREDVREVVVKTRDKEPVS